MFGFRKEGRRGLHLLPAACCRRQLQVHGNVCLASVVVTQTLDWKLHAFDVLSDFNGNNEMSNGPMLQFEWLVGSQYKSMELVKSDWAAIRLSPPWAIDSWGWNERFETMLGPERSAYIRDRGAGSKPKTCTAEQRIRAQLERENVEFRRQAKEDRRLFEMEKEKRDMALQLESQVASQQAQMHEVQASVKSQFTTLQQFKDRRQIPM